MVVQELTRLDEMISQLGIELPELQPSHSSSSVDSKSRPTKKSRSKTKSKDQIPIDPILLTPPTAKSTTRSRTQDKPKSKKASPISKKKKSGRTKVETVVESLKSKAKTNKTSTKNLIKRNEPESTPLKSIDEVTVPKVEKKGRKVNKRKP